MEYKQFLENKIVVAESFGFDIKKPIGKLLPHAQAITKWAIKGGRRAIFASFGLTKTAMQLELAYQCIQKEKKPFIICMPLGVIPEFRKDNEEFFGGKFEIEYITDTDSIDNYEPKIYVTNYERVRKGDIDAAKFCGCSFDEASILRNLKTETSNYVLQHFKNVKYRFVATATPTPNDFIEILNYADFLGVIDRGHALTRFFKRDSVKAGNLTLYENKREEFWKWVSTWAVFINKPSDLGFSDEGYNLPKLNIHEIEVSTISDETIINKTGDIVLFKDVTKSLQDTGREKSSTVKVRVQKAFEIVNDHGKYDNWLLWHHLNSERDEIERVFKQDEFFDLHSVHGGQTNELKERLLTDFAKTDFQILSTKPKIAGSGCNFQHACHKMIFVGIDYKFNDFIQAIHRAFRFRQKFEVDVYIIFTDNEREVLKTLFEKWRKHVELQEEMINIVREYGLNTDKIISDMKRQLFDKRRMAVVGDATVYNEDTTIIHQEMADNSTGMILTSIPFGDHYEYSDNYNDFGHNNGNENFFKQMEYLTPHLLRTLKPGRICAVHVKDRPRYSHQTDVKFFTMDPFSDDTVRHFTKKKVKDMIEFWENLTLEDGVSDELKQSKLSELRADYADRFYYLGRITVTTDVVRENNQTYRLGWGEQRKDATKMGVGIPEYILLFRKKPSHTDNAYADDPVIKKIDDYLLSLWQLDAHAYWKTSGDRFLTLDEMRKYDLKHVMRAWKEHNTSNIYDFQKHVEACDQLDEVGKLSKEFMVLPPISNQEMVWTDVNRMRTLNANQENRKKEKHICPLQLDIIERLIHRFTNEGDLIDDPFGGLFSTAYVALQKKRKAISAELKPEYYDDGLFYLKSIEYKINVPTLFDLKELRVEAI